MKINRDFKGTVLLFLTIIATISVHGQFIFNIEWASTLPKYAFIDSSVADTSKLYLFTKNGDATTKSEYADYYRHYKIISANPLIFRIKEYWMNAALKRSYTCINADFNKRVGEYTTYNREGKLTY
jgi:hypothetical protein